MALHVRKLDRSEEEQLNSWLTRGDDNLGHRARIVLLSAQGRRVPEIGRILGAHPANLRKWIHRFNSRGCQGLITVRSGGAKPRLSVEQRARIVALAEKRPGDLGLSFATWTLHKLAEQARKRGIVDRVSHECVRQILKAAGCSYKSTIP